MKKLSRIKMNDWGNRRGSGTGKQNGHEARAPKNWAGKQYYVRVRTDQSTVSFVDGPKNGREMGFHLTWQFDAFSVFEPDDYVMSIIRFDSSSICAHAHFMHAWNLALFFFEFWFVLRVYRSMEQVFRLGFSISSYSVRKWYWNV